MPELEPDVPQRYPRRQPLDFVHRQADVLKHARRETRDDIADLPLPPSRKQNRKCSPPWAETLDQFVDSVIERNLNQ